MEISVDLVRQILGPLADGLTDEQISNSVMLAAVRAEISKMCPTWADIDNEDDIDTLNIAIAYLVSARLFGSEVGTGAEVRSESLGDQSITYTDGYMDQTRADWRRDAARMIANVCPVKKSPSLADAVIFTSARGRRGR